MYLSLSEQECPTHMLSGHPCGRGGQWTALQRWRLKTYQASVYRWYTVSAPESLDLCDRGGVSPDVLDNQGPRRINTFISTCPPTLIRSTDALSQNWVQSEATQHNINLSGSNQNISTNIHDIESKVKWSPGSLAYCRSCTRIYSSSKKDASLGKF